MHDGEPLLCIAAACRAQGSDPDGVMLRFLRDERERFSTRLSSCSTSLPITTSTGSRDSNGGLGRTVRLDDLLALAIGEVVGAARIVGHLSPVALSGDDPGVAARPLRSPVPAGRQGAPCGPARRLSPSTRSRW